MTPQCLARLNLYMYVITPTRWRMRIERRLLSLYKANMISNRIRTVGSLRPMFYGLLNVHINNVSSILSFYERFGVKRIWKMVDWKCSVPFLNFPPRIVFLILSNFLILLKVCSNDKLLVLFDSVSLHTNVSLQNTLQEYPDTFYRCCLCLVIIPNFSFRIYAFSNWGGRISFWQYSVHPNQWRFDG